MIRLATVFSGIGAIEHALYRMGIGHKIAFACDNGDVDILSKKIKAKNVEELKKEIRLFLDKYDININDNSKFFELIEEIDEKIKIVRDSIKEIEDIKDEKLRTKKLNEASSNYQCYTKECRLYKF